VSAWIPNSACPLVSAIIPTHGRPHCLRRAVRSALGQSWSNLEILVIVDGPDAATMAHLAALGSARVRVVVLEQGVGAAEARNIGVRAARGEWIAFLDDDDEWLPRKIERQMRAVQNLHDWFPVVSTRVMARTASSRRILPESVYDGTQPLADFLFCRRRVGDPGGVMQCSTLLAPRDLLLAIPFQSGLPMHQDWDWLIHVACQAGVSFTMLRESLSVWRVEEGRSSVGRTPDWKFSLAWIRSVRPLISRRAFSWFVAVECAWRAQASHAGWRARLQLLRAWLMEGRPQLRSLLHLFLFSLVPGGLRHWLRRLRHALLQAAHPEALQSGPALVYARGPELPVRHKSSL
jgi:glycosyltransferase involved in cell wall biosynthesis